MSKTYYNSNSNSEDPYEEDIVRNFSLWKEKRKEEEERLKKAIERKESRTLEAALARRQAQEDVDKFLIRRTPKKKRRCFGCGKGKKRTTKRKKGKKKIKSVTRKRYNKNTKNRRKSKR